MVQYVARRKLVLELFGKILNNELDNTRSTGHIDEKLLHNLIFQQSSNDPSNSDLWLVNEDYFKGCSEETLDSITYNGERIFREDFNEEARTLTSLGENRLEKRPNILLFPDDGKCIYPSRNIHDFGENRKRNSELYTEIIKYSTLLERAKLRNKIFIQKHRY